MKQSDIDSAERARDRLQHYGELIDSEIGCRQIQLVILTQLLEKLEHINIALLKGQSK